MRPAHLHLFLSSVALFACSDASPPRSLLDAGGDPVAEVPSHADGGLPLDAGSERSPAAEPAPSAVVQATLPDFTLPDPRPFIRIDLEATKGGAVRVQGLSRAVLALRPLPALSPDYLLIAYRADGTVATAVPVSFSWTMRESYLVGEEVAHREKVTPVSTHTAFVDAEGVSRLELVTPSGTVEARVESGDIPGDKATSTSVSPALGRSQRSLTRAELASKYPHIQVLGQGDDARLSRTFLEAAELKGDMILVDPSEAAVEVVASALDKLTPAVRGAVARIGFVNAPLVEGRKRFLGLAYGSEMLIDVASADQHRDKTEGTIIHESTHCFAFLCGVASGSQDGFSFQPKAWSEEAVAAAGRVVSDFKLLRGLTIMWRHLHQSGYATKRTTPYTDPGANDDNAGNDDHTGDAWATLSHEDATQGGFASNYGSTNATEDLADYVATTQRPTWEKPGICPLFLTANKLNAEIAIPYAKLVLLRGIGAISESRFDSCVRAVSIRGASRGIQFEGTTASFVDDLTRGIVEENGVPLFHVHARGPSSYAFIMEIQLEKPTDSPLGLHRVEPVTTAGSFKLFRTGGAAAYLANEEDSFKARVGRRGLVLISEYSKDRVEGVVFGLELENPLGQVTDTWSLGTIVTGQ